MNLKPNSKPTIGIITLFPSINYGSNFLSLALQTTLQKLGHPTELIYYSPEPRKRRMKIFSLTTPKNASCTKLIRTGIRLPIETFLSLINISELKLRNKYISEFRNKYHVSSKKQYFNHQELITKPPEYDIYITGGDQVWNPVVFDDVLDPAYFLDFVPKNKKKISYAVSLGTFNPEKSNTFRELIKNIDAISVRERLSIPQLEKITGRQVTAVLDPALLLTAKEWEKYELQPKQSPLNFILVYAIGTNKKIITTAKMLAQQYNLPIRYIHTRLPFPANRQTYVRPEEFLWYFHHATFIVTNSFHGTVFSILYRKPFYTIQTAGSKLRALDLLSSLGLENRLFDPTDIITKVDTDIDYDHVHLILDKRRQESIEFLKREIDSEKLI